MTRIVEQPALASREVPQRESPLLEVAGLTVAFRGRDAAAPSAAVAGISFAMHRRQTVALVGESGCGKTATALAIMRLLPSAGRITAGSIRLAGRDLATLTPRQMLDVRGREVAMIFQEPMTSLNPVFTVGDQIIEAIELHARAGRKRASELACHAMAEVGIPEPHERLWAYPHQFSGGMRQRVMIAMAVACRPKLLIADEPTTALDVTIQAQILDLLSDLQRTHDMGLLLITHDFGVVARSADVVCVMYAGRIIEFATVFDLFDKPCHPYTRGLMRSRPGLRERQPPRRLSTVADIVNNPGEFRRLPGGWLPWWPTATSNQDDYRLLEIEPGHWVACSSAGGADDDVRSDRIPGMAFRRNESPLTGKQAGES